MNLERRLDRVERVLMLALKAGDRERRKWREQSREQTEKLNMVIDAHIKGIDRLDKMAAETEEWKQEQRIAQARFDDRMNKMAAEAKEWDQKQRIAHARFDEQMEKLRIAQDRTDEKIEQFFIAQGRTDKQIDKLQEGQASLQAGQASLQAGHARLDQVMAELAEEHKATERSLKAFLDGLSKGQNGKPPV